MTIRVAVPDVHDETALRAWYDTFRAGTTSGMPAPLFTSFAAMSTSLRNPRTERVRLPIAALAQDGSTVGAALLEYSTEDDLNLVETEIAVPPDQRGQGIGTALWQDLVARATELGRSEAGFELNLPPGTDLASAPGGKFATSAGFVSKHTEDHQVLAWPPAATDIPDGPDQIITWVGPTPDEHLESLATLRSVMEADVPTGELSRDTRTWTPERVAENDARMDRSYRVHTALALTADGAPAGYTVLFVDRAEPADAIQDDTLVARDHRGRGLGTRLKAVAYAAAALRESEVAWVHSWVDPENTAMQRTNAAIGFISAGTLHEMEAELPSADSSPADTGVAAR
ncbi:GNAT family N-acetyltransferase [Dermacoccaceae bacterium W4C1]